MHNQLFRKYFNFWEKYTPVPYQRPLGAGCGHQAAPLVDGETHQLILVSVHHDRGRGDLVLRREEIHHLDTAWLVPREHHHLSVTTP